MKKRHITNNHLAAFGKHLITEELSAGTIEKYLREVRQFSAWLQGASLAKDSASRWKKHLLAERYSPSTVNGKLAALNAFLHFMNWQDCRVKAIKLQRQLFRDQARELTRQEYRRLVETAEQSNQKRLALLMETICSTGIRVSEVPYITLEAVYAGKAEVSLKGKVRTILLPGKLCHKLQKYANKNKITSGEIFLTRGGGSLGRKQIWAEMKALCIKAGIAPSKVFPHNLRHLFARCFYRVYRDIVKLADILGHSSVNTTRIYLVSTGAEHVKALEQMKLIL